MEKDEIKNSDNTGEDIEKSSVDKDLVNDNDNEKNTITDATEETIVSPEEEINSLKKINLQELMLRWKIKEEDMKREG